MSEGRSRVLVIGYGNPGRLDDGLGPALADAIEARHLAGVDVESDYQLSVEDAHTVAAHDVVIFADAAVVGQEPFAFTPVAESTAEQPGYSSHAAEPGDVVALARRLFGAATRAFALGIRGYEFNAFGEGLSGPARRNLDEAVEFLARVLAGGSFETAVRGGSSA
jgi:hydrogenase maturation protease